MITYELAKQLKDMKEKYANFRHAKIIEVLKIEVNEGEGIEGDPIRRVTYLVSFSGKVLAKLGEDCDRKFAGEDETIEIK